MEIVLIGSGNVATRLGMPLKQAGHTITGIYSKTPKNAQTLANTLKAPAISALENVPLQAALYLFAVSDDALPQLVRDMPATKGIWAHTAGSVSMEVFKGYHNKYGVFYPLQTFSRKRSTDLSKVPFLLEAADKETLNSLKKIAAAVSENVHEVSEDQRRMLHTAAVFACNFTNHMYALANELTGHAGLPFDLLHPLMRETAEKAIAHPPKAVQTGPAVRYDKNIIQKHTELLSFAPEIREVYNILTNSIYRITPNKK